MRPDLAPRRRPRSRAVVALPAVLVAWLTLTACGGGGEEETGGGGSDGGSGGSGAGSGGGDCEVSTEGYELFSDPAVTTAPEEGAVFGDGENQLTFVDSGYDEAQSPAYGYDLSYVEDGQAFPMSGGFLEGEGGEVTTVDSVFTSEADGRPGLLTLTRTTTDGATATLGVYCITIAVDE
ncbi:hypothetical protein [Nocardioides nanhaiensis]|uniref:Lipoprotein n=1 Tax=Nocardioides nanhaiensis TaxID=1476871 RepID=A0ABP8WET0_9ACTN